MSNTQYLSVEISRILGLTYWDDDYQSHADLPSGMRVETIKVGNEFQWTITWPVLHNASPDVSPKLFPTKRSAKDDMKAMLRRTQLPIHH